MKLKPASEVIVENTPTNKQAIPIENAMRIALEKIAHSIQNQFYPDDDITLLTPEILVASPDVSSVSYDTIRASVQSLYTLGATYVNDAYKLNFIYTERDAYNVKEISKEILARYFYNVVKWINREKQISQLEKAGMPVGSIGHIDIEAAIERLAMVSSTKAINVATVDKLLQIRDKNERNTHLQEVIQTKSAARSGGIGGIGTRNMFTPKSGVKQAELRLFPKPIIGTLVKWVTAQDDLVCFEYCVPLEGIMFDLQDEDMPIPPDDVHPNCRCRLMIVDPSIDNLDVVGVTFDASVMDG